MITVTTLTERDAVPRAVRCVVRTDGLIDVYQEGDTLPGGAFGLPEDSEADRKSAIRGERDRRILAGVKVGSDWFHTGTQEQLQYMGLLMMGASIPAGTPLKTMDGRNVGATQARMQQLFAAIAAKQAALHAVGDAAIAAGTAAAEVAWPPTYAESGV